jgi:hypothetical protein
VFIDLAYFNAAPGKFFACSGYVRYNQVQSLD